MNDVIKKISGFAMKLVYFTLHYAYVIFFWQLRFLMIRLQKWKKCGAQKRMEKNLASLGAEIFSLHKRDEHDWQKMPSVAQQLTSVEEAESRILEIDEVIEGIKNNYLKKKEEIRGKYGAKKATVGTRSSEDT